MASASPNVNDYVSTERDFVSLLIDLYRDRPVLWKVKHPFYIDKTKRSEALQEILKELKVYKPEYNEQQLKRKINIMRTNFNKERNKLDEKLRSSPHLWYYNELTFLLDQVTQPNSSRRRRRTAASEPIYQSDDEHDESDLEIPETKPRGKMLGRKMEKVFVQKRTANNEEDYDSDLEQHMTVTTTYYKKKRTKEDILAEFWAWKLKEMAEDQRLIAEKIVTDVLLEGEMGNLTRDNATFCQSYPE